MSKSMGRRDHGMPQSAPFAEPPCGRGRHARGGHARGGRGQGLVEFAISLPVVLLMILFGVDFGRVFLGWLALGQAAREAANFAAQNPSSWSFPNLAAQAEYERLITTETSDSNCTLPTDLPEPSFPNGTSLGSPAVVQLSCRFSLITPVISQILGSSIQVSTSASFPVRSGLIEGIPVASTVPMASPTPTPFPTPSPIETIEPIPTLTPAPTAVPDCVVPDFFRERTNRAVDRWTGAGFDANKLVFSPLVPPHYTIRGQSIARDSVVPCDSSLTVTP